MNSPARAKEKGPNIQAYKNCANAFHGRALTLTASDTRTGSPQFCASVCSVESSYERR